MWSSWKRFEASNFIADLKVIDASSPIVQFERGMELSDTDIKFVKATK